MNDAVDEGRRELCKSLEKEEKQLVKGKRYLFLCGEENLTEDKREELDKILQINQPLQEAYLLKEKLRLVFQFSSFKRCATAFGEWISLAEASTLKPLNRLAKTLSRHAQQVLNFFRYRLTSGRIEGMNSVIARIRLKTRGLPSVDYLRLKLRKSPFADKDGNWAGRSAGNARSRSCFDGQARISLRSSERTSPRFLFGARFLQTLEHVWGIRPSWHPEHGRIPARALALP